MKSASSSRHAAAGGDNHAFSRRLATRLRQGKGLSLVRKYNYGRKDFQTISAKRIWPGTPGPPTDEIDLAYLS